MPKASAPSAPCVEVWRVAADQGDAGLAQALLRADDMDDALSRVAEVEQRDAGLVAVASVMLVQQPPVVGIGHVLRCGCRVST